MNNCPSWRNGTQQHTGDFPLNMDVRNNSNGWNWTVTGDQTVDAQNCYVYPYNGYTYWWPMYESRKTAAFHIAMALDKEGLLRSDTKKGFIDAVLAIEKML